uniref:EGF-like domain-containing protein n=1 Tax=Esox lucius TaxID=8010 RepID=A0A3P9A772_ESOLU
MIDVFQLTDSLCLSLWSLSSDVDECESGDLECNIDECQTQHGSCHPFASCLNTAGSFDCTCPPGTEGTGFECQDVDECAENSSLPHNCSLLALCNNMEGSYHCICQEGFQGDGFFCEDVNECLSPLTCKGNMTCHNTPGGYNCTCTLGVTYDTACLDVDECGPLGGAPCMEHSVCKNTIGSFLCSCLPGYQPRAQGNETACEDIDECLFNSTCRGDHMCVNLLGTYRCECPDGYHEEEGACVDTDECGNGNGERALPQTDELSLPSS